MGGASGRDGVLRPLWLLLPPRTPAPTAIQRPRKADNRGPQPSPLVSAPSRICCAPARHLTQAAATQSQLCWSREP